MKRGLHAGRLGSGGFSLNVLTPDELDDIHLATLEVLEQTGVFVEEDEPLDIFSDGGCLVDRERHMVRIPGHIVEEAIRSAPPQVRYYGRAPQHDAIVEPGRVHFINFCEGVKYNDPYTGEYRDPTIKDVGDCALLIDAMDEIVGCDSAIGATDVPTETYALHGVEAALLNTTKQVGCEAVNKREVRECMELAAIAAGGMDAFLERPFVSFGVCAVSPLKLPRDATEVIVECARHDLPQTILSMAMCGGSAPVSLAGTLVVHNAEVLSGIVLAQLTSRGAPVIYGSSTTAMDLRYASASVGSPELAMIGAAVAALSKQYRLPSYIAGA
jgi:trimethylamine---corrinoid protein Co-methyltransferase